MENTVAVRENFKAGDIVRHFKRETIFNPGKQYLYEILGEAQHTETGDKLIVYRALYGDKQVYARPFDMFMSEVDSEKYPNTIQKYRFEKAWNAVNVSFNKDEKCLSVNGHDIKLGESKYTEFEEATQMIGDLTDLGGNYVRVREFMSDSSNKMIVTLDSDNVITGIMIKLNLPHNVNVFTFDGIENFYTHLLTRYDYNEYKGQTDSGLDKYSVEVNGYENYSINFVGYGKKIVAVSIELKEDTK